MSNMEERLCILFSENISKIEQKFIQYIEDSNEERKSIYYFYKTAYLPRLFHGGLSLQSIVDGIFNHYFDITFDEETDCVDKKIIIDSLSNENKEFVKNSEGIKKSYSW